jgi:pSer/pThr/pTyr-binding forkhead associated (FHA) protein
VEPLTPVAYAPRVAESPIAAHVCTPAELQARHEAERAGEPFLVYRRPGEGQVIVPLTDSASLTIGRRLESDIALPWDAEVSRLHAELHRIGRDWVVVDDGLSTNGTWVGDRKVTGRVPLRDGDLVRAGDTLIAFCSPRFDGSGTAMAQDVSSLVKVSPAQKRVLVELCRPALELKGLAVPPTNQQLAETLFLSVDSIKTHLRALMDTFGVEELPQSQKRAALIERAIRLGVVDARDLTG